MPLTTITAGTVITPETEVYNQTITLDGGTIAAVAPNLPEGQPGDDVLDARDAIVIPGLIDIQVNGALGYSFQAADRAHYDTIIDFHRSAGTTTLLPTLITAPVETLIASLAAVAAYQPDGMTLPGIHLEGPFLSPEKSGAHDQTALRNPDMALMQQFLDAAAGTIKMLTLAPELLGSLDVIAQLVELDVTVSAGHSDSTILTMRSAVDAGLRFVTHAGNASDWPHRAMGEQGFMTSEPGVVGALMADDRLGAGIIMDGFHFHPALLRPLLKLKGAENIVLVSDASTVVGLPPGTYAGGGIEATIHPAGYATSGRGGGWLAGSIITLLEAVQRAVKLAGLTLPQAVTAATVAPARWIGVEEHKGRVAPGLDADLLVLNADLSLRTVIVGGEVV